MTNAPLPSAGARAPSTWADRLWWLIVHPAWWAWPASLALIILARLHSRSPAASLRLYYLPALLLVFVGCLPSIPGVILQKVPARPRLLSAAVLAGLTVAILAGAVTLRLWRIGEWPPPGIGFEEHELGARGDLTGGPLDNLIAMYAAPHEHTLTAYAVSVSFASLGTGFFEMRLPFLIGGLLAPFFFYALCRRLVAWEPTLFGLALFAVSWWQIAGSRPADEIFFPLWVEIAVLWLLVRFEDTAESWVAFALALSSGLLIYEYSAYHLAMPLVIAYCAARFGVFTMRALRAPQPWKQRWRRLVGGAWRYAPGGAAMLLVWTIIARLQLIADLQSEHGWWLFEGIRRHGNNGIVGLLGNTHALLVFGAQRVTDAVRSFSSVGFNGEDRFFGTDAYPPFDPFSAAAIGVGTLLVALTIRRRFHLFVLSWTVIIILGAALLPGNVNTQRYYVALPFFYLLATLGAAVVWDWAQRPRARMALCGLFAIVTCGAAVANLHRLYWDLIPDQRMRANWIWPRTELIRWIREHPRDAPVCIVANDDNPGITGANPVRSEWLWLLRGWTVRAVPTLDGCLPDAAPGAPPHYIVFALPDVPADLQSTVRRSYPQAQELPPIVVPQHGFSAHAFDVSPPGD